MSAQEHKNKQQKKRQALNTTKGCFQISEIKTSILWQMVSPNQIFV